MGKLIITEEEKRHISNLYNLISENTLTTIIPDLNYDISQKIDSNYDENIRIFAANVANELKVDRNKLERLISKIYDTVSKNKDEITDVINSENEQTSKGFGLVEIGAALIGYGIFTALVGTITFPPLIAIAVLTILSHIVKTKKNNIEDKVEKINENIDTTNIPQVNTDLGQETKNLFDEDIEVYANRISSKFGVNENDLINVLDKVLGKIVKDDSCGTQRKALNIIKRIGSKLTIDNFEQVKKNEDSKSLNEGFIQWFTTAILGLASIAAISAGATVALIPILIMSAIMIPQYIASGGYKLRGNRIRFNVHCQGKKQYKTSHKSPKRRKR